MTRPEAAVSPKARQNRTSNRPRGSKCPRSESVKACWDSCRGCRKFTKNGHDQQETIFRDYLPASERPVLRPIFRAWRNDD